MTFPVQTGALLRRTPLLPDESLPSFLERITRLNHYPSLTMLSGICADRMETWFGQDHLDCPRRAETFLRLAQLTQVPAEALFAASRHGFAPAFQLPYQAAETLDGVGMLLPPIQARRYLRPDTAAQYCPQCLEDSPHHRLHWIPIAAAVCLEHDCFLVAGCPRCQRPLAIHDVVSRRCPACQADLCSAPRVPVGEDEAGIRSQQWLQGWLCGTLLPEAFGNNGLPAEHLAILYELVECAARWLQTVSWGWPPRQRYALYRDAFTALGDWPQGLFAILDEICKGDPHPSKCLNPLQQRWFQPSRSGPAYDFLKQAFVAYRVSRDLPIQTAFAHRWKHARWFVQGTGIWSAERTAQALDLPVGDLNRFYPEGALQDCLWSDSPKWGSLFWRKRVLAVRQRWQAGWSLADASCWLGLDETEVIHLVVRGRLALKDGDPQGDPATWLFNRSTVADFFQAVIARLRPSPDAPSYLCSRFEEDRHLHSVGMDWALLIEQVLDGLLPAYQQKESIRALDDLCFDVNDMDTWPDRWYAMQGLVSDQVFAHETMVSPKWIDEWVAANWIAPVLCFGRVCYYDRAALEQVAASLDILDT